MGENYRFFDSIDGEDERFYTADEFAEYFRQFIRNGILNGGENLKVVTDEKDMKVSIKPGYAWIEGYLYKISGEDLILEHGIADPSLNRIDRVVIRLDKTLENRYVKAFILEGTPESTPEAPELTRNDNIYEISLAKIEIIAGKSFIENYKITDERLDNTVCGLTTHLFEQIDTAGIFDEWQNYLIHKRNVSDLSYEEFVTAYQNIWNSWIEDKIVEPSGEFYAEWKSWFNEVQDTTNLVTKSQFDGFKENYENSIGQPHGIASLDEEGSVNLGQLNNVHKNNYIKIVGELNNEMEEEIPEAFSRIEGEKLPDGIGEYLPFIRFLYEKRDEVYQLLSGTKEDGKIPRYALPGMTRTKAIYMNDMIGRLTGEFSREKNVTQREIVEAALIEYLQKYGYKVEIEALLKSN